MSERKKFWILAKPEDEPVEMFLYQSFATKEEAVKAINDCTDLEVSVGHEIMIVEVVKAFQVKSSKIILEDIKL